MPATTTIDRAAGWFAVGMLQDRTGCLARHAAMAVPRRRYSEKMVDAVQSRKMSPVRLAGLLAGAAFLTLAAAPVVAQTEPYEAPKQIVASPAGVDLSSGRFTSKSVDLAIGPLSLERSYLGGHLIDGATYFGMNWTHNYAVFVSEGDWGATDKTRVVIGRSSVHFTKSSYSYPSYSINNPDAFGSSLKIVNGAFVYTDRDGNVYTFNPSVNAFSPLPNRLNQRVARIDYADGHTLNYSYNGSGQLIQIASNKGYSLVFEYGATGYVSKACGYNRAVTYLSANPTCAAASASVSYSYVYTYGGYQLGSVIDVMNQVWGYDYNEDSNVSRLSCVRQVNSSSCLVSNAYLDTSYPGRVSQQTTADGGVWNYGYDTPVKAGYDDPHLPGTPPAYASGSYSDPAGKNVVAVFGGGLLNSASEGYTTNPSDPWATVHRTTTATWNGVELESLAYPEGNSIFYGRDGRGNVTGETWTPKSGSGSPTVSRSTTYPDSGLTDCTTVVRRICNKPIAKTDYNGNQTDFTYDPASGNVLTATGPAVNGIRPQTRYGYVQRYAWVKTSSGGYVQETTPIWLLSSEKTCRTTATVGDGCSGGAGDEIVTSYDYGPDSGPNNLLLRGKLVTGGVVGSGGVALLTCFGYDAASNQISQTSPRGTVALTVCP